MRKDLDEKLWNRNLLFCGVDEAGRGALAGPVVAAAVVLNPQSPVLDARDSKLLTPRQRSVLAEQIRQQALAWAIGMASHRLVDTHNILRATMTAMRRAIENLSPHPQYALVDGCAVPNVGIPCEPVIHGDGLSLSIACASILAKVYRDKLMLRFHHYFPEYGFARNKGYGTTEHIAALHRYGVSPIHRLTFGPVKTILPQ